MGRLAPSGCPVRANPTETATHLVATVINGLVIAWVYNATGGTVLLAALLHGAQNATSGLVMHLLQGVLMIIVTSHAGPSRSLIGASSALIFLYGQSAAQFCRAASGPTPR